jgi:hypothetical protein
MRKNAPAVKVTAKAYREPTAPAQAKARQEPMALQNQGFPRMEALAA